MSTETKLQQWTATIAPFTSRILRDLKAAEEDTQPSHGLYDTHGKFRDGVVHKIGLAVTLYIHALGVGLMTELLTEEEYNKELVFMRDFLRQRSTLQTLDEVQNLDWQLGSPAYMKREELARITQAASLNEGDYGAAAPKFRRKRAVAKSLKKYPEVDFSAYATQMTDTLASYPTMFRVGVLIESIIGLFRERLIKYKDLLTIADFIHPNGNVSKKGAPLFSDQGAHIIFEGIDPDTQFGKSLDKAIRELSSSDILDEVWELELKVELEELLMKITPQKEEDFFQLVMKARNRIKRKFEPPKKHKS